MRSARTVVLAALAVVTCCTPTFADSEMQQSPLLMRRAGPSCQPGNLGAQPGAGYLYRLGPCASVDGSAGQGIDEGGRVRGRRRRY